MKTLNIIFLLFIAVFSNAQSDTKTEVTTEGFYTPRLTSSDRLGITLNTSKKGMIVYDIEQKKYYYTDGVSWQILQSSKENIWIDSTSYITFSRGNIVVSDTSDANFFNNKAYLYPDKLIFDSNIDGDRLVYGSDSIQTQTFSGNRVTLNSKNAMLTDGFKFSRMNKDFIQTGILLNGNEYRNNAKLSNNLFGGKLEISNSNGNNTVEIGNENYGYIQLKNPIGDTLFEVTNNNVQTSGILTLNGIQSKLKIEGLDLGYKPGGHMGIDGDVVPYNSSSFDIGNNVAGQNWDQVVANQFLMFSDARLKQNIKSVPKGSLDKIMKLNPVSYQYKSSVDIDQRQRFGLLAQDVQKIFPEVVVSEDVDVDKHGNIIRTKSENLSMNYIELIPHLIKALQEQQKIIDELRIKVGIKVGDDK